ncbi:MAG TPA: hypothetical protein PLA50_10190 [Bacteroidia bacterium]|nr:hypothetical protein [Bacteroidia bacterium]
MGFFWRTLPDEVPDERGKVFDWTREKRIWLHVAAFLMFSVLVHGAGFYLFKVVYPTPVRLEPEPDAITVMEAGDPAARSVLQRLSDRTVYLLPPSAQSNVRVRLEEQRVHFTPAFQRAELELLPPPSLRPGPGLPESLPRGDAPSPAAILTAESPVRIKLAPDLADRAYAPWSILHDYLRLADGLPLIRLSIAIAPDGSVDVTGVQTEGLDSAEREEMASVVESTLRFVPAAESVSGWIEIGGG